MRDLAELDDRSPQALLGVVDQREDPRVRRLLHLGTGETERKRQAEQPLLRAVVEVSFETTALGFARCDDARTRGAQVLDPSQDLRVESLIIERQTRRRGDLLDDGRVVEETRAMEEQGDRSALARERCLRQSLGDIHRLPVRIDQLLSPVEGICEPERRVAQGTTKHLLEPAGRRRFAELDDEPRPSASASDAGATRTTRPRDQ